MTSKQDANEPLRATRRCVGITSDEHGSVQIAFVLLRRRTVFTPTSTTTLNLQPKKANCHD
jgi:hypothetical protein